MDTRETMKQLNKLLNLVDLSYVRIAKENGLTYNSLMIFYLLEDTGTLTQKQVCDTLHLPKSSVHSLMEDLMGSGYLLLAPGGNKKEKYITLTSPGKDVMRKISSETDLIEGKTLKSLSERDINGFLKTAEKLADRLAAETETAYGKA